MVALFGSVLALTLLLLPTPDVSALTVESETGLYSVPQGGKLIFNITSYPNTTLYVSIMHIDKNSHYTFFWHRPLVTDSNGTAFIIYSAMCVDEEGNIDLLSQCGMDLPTDANENDRYVLMISDNETHRKITIDVSYSQNYQDAVNRAWRERDRRDASAFMSSVDLRMNLATYGWPVIFLMGMVYVVHVLGIKRIDTIDRIAGGFKFVWRKIRKKDPRIIDIPSKEEEFRRDKEKAESRIEYLVDMWIEQERVLDELSDEIGVVENKRGILYTLQESSKSSTAPLTKEEVKKIGEQLGVPEGGKSLSRS